MEGTIRSLYKKVGKFIFNQINKIAESTVNVFRGQAKLIELSI